MNDRNINKNNTKLKVNDGGTAFTLLIILYVLLNTVVSAVISLFSLTGTIKNVILSLISPTTIFLVLLSYKKKRNLDFMQDIGITRFSKKFIGLSFLLAIGVVFAFGTLNELVAKLVTALGGKVNASSITTSNHWQYAIYIFTLCIIPAFFEEVFFRGLLLSSFKGCNKWISIISVSFVFAIYHGNLAQFIYQFIYGIILAILTLSAKSVIPAIITHFLNNFIVLSFMHFEIPINLYSWYIILIGAILTVGSLLFIIRKINFTTKGEEKIKAFYIPYALFGIIICCVLIITGVVL